VKLAAETVINGNDLRIEKSNSWMRINGRVFTSLKCY
jgi:hypothetical protein